ncbi:hypothetical protein JCM19233_2779 [Vibrio astriarenae]|nr:hypothetical protein JCM19233_2779 [Vibrio sp. C7]
MVISDFPYLYNPIVIFNNLLRDNPSATLVSGELHNVDPKPNTAWFACSYLRELEGNLN